MDKIDSKLKSIIMPSYRHVELQEAELGNRAGMIGATYGVLKKHFEKELYKTNKMINLPERIKNNDAKMKINIEYNL